MRVSRIFLAPLVLLILFSAQDLRAQDMSSFRQAELARYARRTALAPTNSPAMKKYDVHHYALNLFILRDNPRFGGSVRTLLRATTLLDTIQFNMIGTGVVDSVRVNGQRLTTVQLSNDLLTIVPESPFTPGTLVTTEVWYSMPFAGSALSVRSVANVQLGRPTTSIASQAEPYDARKWWPCKDETADKADSIHVTVTTNSELFPVSNGVMDFDRDNRDGTHTVGWSSRYPIVTYLVSVAIAEYNRQDYTFTHESSTMPVTNWSYSLTEPNADQNAQFMLEGLRTFSTLFIPYPFMKEKYGMAEYEWGGAMEHQTVSSMGFYGRDVVVHELAHQWFGDKVTCDTFEHIWLNEGWATYCEALFDESIGGAPALQAKMMEAAYYGSGTIYVDDPEGKDFSRIFSGSLTYNKASWVVHMLRHVVGDEAFFSATRKYLGDESLARYRTVTTDEFRGYYERESGKDLTAFFRQWIFGEYYPTYRLGWTNTPDGSEHVVRVNIQQLYLPDRQLFIMPVDLTFTVDGKDTTLVVMNDRETQTWEFRFPQPCTSVQIDKDNWILKKVVQSMAGATLDQGILLVNGVDWDVESYTADIKAAYRDSVFTGSFPYRFWDLFPNPTAGYPPNLSKIQGSGFLPASELGKYCTVVWIGNGYNGDETVWETTPIWEYLKAGGNVVLITRLGRVFVADEVESFLGIRWTGTGQSTVNECISRRSDLLSMTFTGDQSLVAPFQTTLDRPENEILFVDNVSLGNPVGLGVWGQSTTVESKPTGQMVFLSMRPYRVDRAQLKANMQTILPKLTCSTSDLAPLPSRDAALSLSQGYPNPVLPGMRTVSFTLGIAEPSPQTFDIRLLDALGREVQPPRNLTFAPGRHVLNCPVEGLPAGVYSLHVHGAQGIRSASLVVVK